MTFISFGEGRKKNKYNSQPKGEKFLPVFFLSSNLCKANGIFDKVKRQEK